MRGMRHRAHDNIARHCPSTVCAVKSCVASGCVCKCVYGTCLVCVRDASRVSPGVSMKGMRVASGSDLCVCVKYMYAEVHRMARTFSRRVLCISGVWPWSLSYEHTANMASARRGRGRARARASPLTPHDVRACPRVPGQSVRCRSHTAHRVSTRSLSISAVRPANITWRAIANMCAQPVVRSPQLGPMHHPQPSMPRTRQHALHVCVHMLSLSLSPPRTVSRHVTAPPYRLAWMS
jgi:hypothetical protein